MVGLTALPSSWISKWRWQPVDPPVLPTRATVWPAEMLAPTGTEKLCRWWLELVISLPSRMPWLRINLLPAPLLWVRAITRPEWVALTPVPQVAGKSTPACSRRVPQIGWVRHPKFEFMRMSMGRTQPLLDAAAEPPPLPPLLELCFLGVLWLSLS